MLDSYATAAAATTSIESAPGADRSHRYCGPDRRRPAPISRECLSAVLDELDYGIVLLSPEGEIVHMNHAAAVELESGHPLQRADRHLQARSPSDATEFRDALRSASERRLRKLVSLGECGEQVGVSVVPIETRATAASRDPVPTLLVLGKRRVCESLTVQGFATRHQLTNAETRVLGALCSGMPPNRIAKEIGVAISTVRTHISTIRVKTGSDSIRALVAKVARLPPLMSALRQPPFSSRPMAREGVKALDRLQ